METPATLVEKFTITWTEVGAVALLALAFLYLAIRRKQHSFIIPLSLTLIYGALLIAPGAFNTGSTGLSIARGALFISFAIFFLRNTRPAV